VVELAAGRLRVRGRPHVFHAIYLKVAGWNILRALVCAKMREIVHQRANRVVLRGVLTDFSAILGRLGPVRGPAVSFEPLCGDLTRFFTLPVAA
jgi:hypothetical protein